jgi:rhodanese-related sulfurtransferase
MSTIPRLSPAEAHAKLAEGYTYVDVRSEVEFDEGHPAGAVNVPIMHSVPSGMTPNVDFLSVMLATFPKNTKLILGCKSGGRSLRAAQLLEDNGYTELIDQRAGFDGSRNAFGKVTEPGWAHANLPVEEGAPKGRSYSDMKARHS